MRPRLLIVGLSLLALTAGTANADPIASLYNTGVDNNHNALATNANPLVADPHYSITGTNPNATYPVVYTYGSPWVPNETNPAAQWISPNNPGQNGQINGTYSYTTHFDLSTGANPLTASITGKFAADDIITAILLNGSAVGVAVVGGVPTGYPSYDKWFDFTISSSANFVAGDNKLEFVSANTHNVVTGLIVQMSGTYTAVPEPASVTVAALGAAGFALMSLRRRRKASA